MAFPIQFSGFVPIYDTHLRGFHGTRRICGNQWAVNLPLRQPQNGPHLHQELKQGNEVGTVGLPGPTTSEVEQSHSHLVVVY
jgi:hypothetical protein